VSDDSDTPSAPEVVWPYEHRLKEPVIAHGKETYTFKLRRPTAGDMLKYGVLDQTIDAAKTFDMIADLAGVPPSAVKLLHPKDFYKIQGTLISFYMAAAA
jgi:hypothetical protein